MVRPKDPRNSSTRNPETGQVRAHRASDGHLVDPGQRAEAFTCYSSAPETWLQLTWHDRGTGSLLAPVGADAEEPPEQYAQ